MTILSGDIKLFESDTMDDVATGGGAITSSVIVDGASNNIFDDISSLSRKHGAANILKVFAGIATQTQDKYFDAHIIIAKLPGDKKLGITLFNTKDWFDRRAAAQSRIENYLAQGGVYNGTLWATQFQGSRAIIIYQSLTAPVPGISDVLVLVSPTDEQFVRISRLNDEIQEFTDGNGVYKKRILTLEITEPLNHDFIGVEISKYDNINSDSRIYNTVVANAAKYYSASALANAAKVGDYSIKAESIFSQIVPSTQSEVSLVDQTAGGASVPIIESSQKDVVFTDSTNYSPNSSFHIGGSLVPGSLSIIVSGDTLTDSGGQIKNSTGTVVATVSYADGITLFTASSPNYSGNKTITFRPAAAPQRLADTISLPVTAANRGYVWNININPAPLPGSIKVAFRALNKWYELLDNGSGGLVGADPSIGSGNALYATGSISVTTGVLPDADSEIIFSWSTKSAYINRSNISPPPLTIVYQLLNQSIQANSLVVTWNDGIERQASCNLAGIFSGDAIGQLSQTTGEIKFIPNTIPLKGSVFRFNYSFGDLLSFEINSFANTQNTVTLDTGHTDVVPGSISIAWQIVYNIFGIDIPAFIVKRTGTAGELIKDDGQGNLISVISGASVGTFNYPTGIATFNGSIAVEYSYYDSVSQTYEMDAMIMSRVYPSDTLSTATFDTSLPSVFDVKLRTAADATAPEESLTLEQIQIDVTPDSNESIVPGSFIAEYGGEQYFDRQGQLYYDIDRATGAGIFAGTFDYSTGLATLTNWVGGAANSGVLHSLLTDVNYTPVDQVVFRIPSAPVKVGSLSIRAVPADGGDQINAVVNADGSILTADMDGHLEYENGVVNIRFGQWVTAAGNEAEWWYDAFAIVEGQIFKPRHVYADTIFFNAVSFSFIPLSKEILGLDPVRLPVDGRVPVFAKGDLAVVLHDQNTTGTYSNNTQTDIGRGRLAKLTVRDAGKNLLPDTAFTADLDLGIVDWLDLTGISQPLTITDRIEDSAIVTDVQITGEISLSLPLTHDFPVAETLVSNAVLYGDLFAHTSIPFDQKTWTGEWSDSLIGSTTVAQYNNTQYPIAVDNASTFQEDWAIIFTSSTDFNVIGRHVGQIATGSINTDTAPINPNTNEPYFIILAAGWGAGWSSGNVLRFNTYATNIPAWLIQAVNPGDATNGDYIFCLEVRGDINTP